MASEAPSFGFKPSNRLQKEQVAFLAWKAATGKESTFEEFTGTNMHLALQSPFNILENYEGKMVKLQADVFDTFKKEGMEIKGSYGSSKEGWLNVFEKYCEGINLVDFYSDPIRASDWPVVKKIDGKPLFLTPIRKIFEEIIKENKTSLVGKAPGEFEVYFDNLKNDANLAELFKKVVGPAEFTTGGDNEVKVQFSDGQERVYNFFNTLPDDYRKIDVQIKLIYKSQGITYGDDVIKEEIRKRFADNSYIGRDIYLPSLFCVPDFSGLAAVELKYRNTGSTAWQEGPIHADPDTKYTLVDIEVIR